MINCMKCRDHEDAVAALAASPSGDSFASASWDGSLRIWATGGRAPPGSCNNPLSWSVLDENNGNPGGGNQGSVRFVTQDMVQS